MKLYSILLQWSPNTYQIGLLGDCLVLLILPCQQGGSLFHVLLQDHCQKQCLPQPTPFFRTDLLRGLALLGPGTSLQASWELLFLVMRIGHV